MRYSVRCLPPVPVDQSEGIEAALKRLYVAVIKGEVRARFKGRVYGSEWLKQIASQLRPIRTGSGSWNRICGTQCNTMHDKSVRKPMSRSEARFLAACSAWCSRRRTGGRAERKLSSRREDEGSYRAEEVGLAVTFGIVSPRL